MAGDGASPLVLRRRLRAELRAARLKKGLTQDQVAKAMEWSLSKMNRIEKAKTGISANDLRALLPEYDITDKEQTEELLALARAARQPGWWSQYSEVAPSGLLELIDYESAASAVSQFETMFVPGILQVEDYASAILQAFYDEKPTAERVAALVELRTKRRDLLSSKDAPEFSFVLDESVIHRQVGSPAITRRQFRHLVTVAKLSNVKIQIVPFTVGLHPGMTYPFEVVQFEDTPDENIVFIEGPSGDVIIDDAEEVRDYLGSFERIMALSLGPSESIDLLDRASREMS
jgi:transcriptional regulator with XRE-family HTH domain